MGVKELIPKELNIPSKMDGEASNKDTLAAIAELMDGKGKRFKDVDALFKSI